MTPCGVIVKTEAHSWAIFETTSVLEAVSIFRGAQTRGTVESVHEDCEVCDSLVSKIAQLARLEGAIVTE